MEKQFKNSVIVAHPMQQHSYRLSEALNNEGLLHSYITTVYYDENKAIYKLLNKVLNEENVQRMKNRVNKSVDSKVISMSEFLGLFLLLIFRIDKKKKISPYISRMLRKSFGEKVAKFAIENKVKAVVIYDKWGSYCAKYLKENSDIITIMDMSSITSESIVKIANEDISKSQEKNEDQYDIILRPYKQTFLNEFNDEIRNSDYFLTPSLFSKKSVLKIIEDPSNVYVCPYGVDIEQFKEKEDYTITNDTIKFLYVGRLSAAKGVFYLLEAFKQLNDNRIELICVGQKIGSEELFSEYEGYYTYLGGKLNSEMNEIYQSSDVYIMPSLWEGMSLTLGEAMASGLPVIATRNSGAESVVKENVNGFLIESMSISEIKDKVLWFIENKDEIETMGKQAAKIINQQTWDKYSSNVSKAVLDILES